MKRRPAQVPGLAAEPRPAKSLRMRDLLASFSRFKKLPVSQQRLLVETVANLAWAAFAVQAIPFRRLVSTRPPARGADMAPVELRRLARTVENVARRVPWRAVCIEQAVCLRAMLRRRGISSEFHYGIARGDQADLKGHVWLSVGEEVVIGGQVAGDFTLVGSFPS